MAHTITGAQLSGSGAQLSGSGAQLSESGAQLSAISAYLHTSYLGAQLSASRKNAHRVALRDSTNRNGEVEDSTEHPGQGIGLTEKCRPVRAKYEPLSFTKECFKELFTFLSFRLQ